MSSRHLSDLQEGSSKTIRPCSHWQIRIMRGEQKVFDFTTCPLLVVGARSDWTKVAIFPPVLPELAAWERCTHCKNHVNIKRDVHFQTLGIKHICGVGTGQGGCVSIIDIFGCVLVCEQMPTKFNIALHVFEFWHPLSF